MPVIRSAKKKLKVDIKRESINKKVRSFVDFIVKIAQRKPTAKSVQEAFKVIDKAVKNNIMHKNKAARLKSKLSKLMSKKTSASENNKTRIAKAISKAPKEKKSKEIKK